MCVRLALPERLLRAALAAWPQAFCWGADEVQCHRPLRPVAERPAVVAALLGSTSFVRSTTTTWPTHPWGCCKLEGGGPWAGAPRASVPWRATLRYIPQRQDAASSPALLRARTLDPRACMLGARAEADAHTRLCTRAPSATRTAGLQANAPTHEPKPSWFIRPQCWRPRPPPLVSMHPPRRAGAARPALVVPWQRGARLTGIMGWQSPCGA